LARIGSVYAHCYVSLLQNELLDFEIKNLASSIIMTISELSRIAIPFIITFFNKRGIYPIVFFSIILLLFGVLPTLALKNTHNQQNSSK